jgi:hypothetical protein
VFDAETISRSVTALAADANAGPAAQRVISQVCARSTDGDLQVACLRALRGPDDVPPSSVVALSGSAAGQ